MHKRDIYRIANRILLYLKTTPRRGRIFEKREEQSMEYTNVDHTRFVNG
jgi:hypothetical protein